MTRALTFFINAFFLSVLAIMGTTFDGKYARLSDGETFFIHDRKMEEAPTIVFLHGFAANLDFYHPLMQHMKEKEGAYNWLSMDWYGFGFSEVYVEKDYDIELYMKQLRELLVHLGSKDNNIIVGHSMGGLLAAHFASKYPEMVKELILLSPSALPYDIFDALSSPMSIGHRIFYNSLMHGFTQSTAIEIHHLAILYADRLLRCSHFLLKLLQPILPISIENGRALVSMSLKNIVHRKERNRKSYQSAVQSVLSNLKMCQTSAHSHVYEGFEMPTTIVMFNNDPMFPPSSGFKAFRQSKSSDMRYIVIPRSGHEGPFTHPEEIFEVLLTSRTMTARKVGKIKKPEIDLIFQYHFCW